MREKFLFITTFIVFAVLALLIFQKEHILRSGKTILLKLTIKDPRSLIQGDYMTLRYDLANEINRNRDKIKRVPGIGKIVVTLDENNVATFSCFYEGGRLKKNEHLLVYKKKGNRIIIAPDSFFFQEGDAHYYNEAKYAELKVTGSGNSILAGLCDKNFRKIQPNRDLK